MIEKVFEFGKDSRSWHWYYCKRVLQEWTTEGKKFLDLGCGSIESHLEEYDRKATCIGVDIDPNLRKHPLHLKIRADGQNLPFKDGTFDAIISIWVIEHISNPEQFLHEVGRCLRSGGSFLLMTNNLCNPAALYAKLIPHSWHRHMKRLFLRNGEAEENSPTFYRANTPRVLAQYLELGGFSHCKFIYFSMMHKYFRGIPMVSRLILWASNLVTDNRFFRFLKMGVIVIATK